MAVGTAPAGNVVYVNGRPTIPPANDRAPGGRVGRADGGGRGDRGRGGRGPTKTNRGGFPYQNAYRCRAAQLTPRYELINPGEALTIDCEGVMLGRVDGKNPRGCGRVSVVTENGGLVYDTFVHYGSDREHVPDPPHLKLGVYKDDIKPENGAQLYEDVLKILKTAFDKSGGLIIGHDLESDQRMLKGLDWSPYETRDTQEIADYRELNNGNPPGLKRLARDVLGKRIQAGANGHSSVEDARITMELWLANTAAFRHATRSQPARSCKKARTGLAPGNLVALPDIPGACPPGHEWDRKTSTYLLKEATQESIWKPSHGGSGHFTQWGTPLDL